MKTKLGYFSNVIFVKLFFLALALGCFAGSTFVTGILQCNVALVAVIGGAVYYGCEYSSFSQGDQK